MKIKIKNLTIASLLLSGVLAPQVFTIYSALSAEGGQTPVLSSDYFGATDFVNRRSSLLTKLGDKDVAALMASELDLYSNDTDYPYHPDVHVRYLTGSKMEQTHLIISKSGATVTETLFAMEKNLRFETWMGRIPSTKENRDMSGINRIRTSTTFKSSLSGALRNLGSGAVLWLDLGTRRSVETTHSETPAQILALEVRKNFPDVVIKNITPLLREMREVKSDNEVAALRRAAEISAKGHKAAMTRSLTAVYEYQVEASLEFVFRDEGADSTGYPSIVGAHSNATILHYNTNNDPLVRNGLMLIDAAAEVEGYTADVTRTWPVDGTFSEAQADIYNLVFEAQSASMAASKKDVMYNVMVKASYDVASKGLLKLGLISEEKREQVSLYYLHGIAHGIGLDVHDPLPRQTPLAVNNVYTIEPGIYVRKGIVENSDVFKALAPDVQKTISVALTKYNNIGVRIEDDILITEDGYENLSKDVPRSIAAIEKHLKQP
jgi:Xaa-Pro aminopeptidase